MQKLLEELRSAALTINTGKVDKMNFALRSRIERYLYLFISRYIKSSYGIDIAGFSQSSWTTLITESKEIMTVGDYELLLKCKQLYLELRGISASPYLFSDGIKDREKSLRVFGENIICFIDYATAEINISPSVNAGSD